MQFRFLVGSSRPTWEDNASFLKRLDRDLMAMEAVYKTAKDHLLFIKFSSLEPGGVVENDPNPRIFVYS